MIYSISVTSFWPPSAPCLYFLRAAQKLNLSKREKPQPPPPPSPPDPDEPFFYTDGFSAALQLSPPPVPPCLLRAGSKVKDCPGMGKVRPSIWEMLWYLGHSDDVMLRTLTFVLDRNKAWYCLVMSREKKNPKKQQHLSWRSIWKNVVLDSRQVAIKDACVCDGSGESSCPNSQGDGIPNSYLGIPASIPECEGWAASGSGKNWTGQRSRQGAGG